MASLRARGAGVIETTPHRGDEDNAFFPINQSGQSSRNAAGGISVLSQVHCVKEGVRVVVKLGIHPEYGFEGIDDMDGGSDLVLLPCEESVRMPAVEGGPFVTGEIPAMIHHFPRRGRRLAQSSSLGIAAPREEVR